MTAGLGRISGPLLKDNLLRNGVDLAFENDLLYLEVNNQRIGIKTSSPSRELEVDGSSKFVDIFTDTSKRLGNVNFLHNSITTEFGKLYLNSTSEITAPGILTDGVKFDNNKISLENLLNLEFRPTRKFISNSNVRVTGNLHATGDITFDGNIIIGDTDLDSVEFNSDFTSNLVPNQTDFYNLGNASRRWGDVYLQDAFVNDISTITLIANGLNLTYELTNSIFVSTNGNNTTNRGNIFSAPFRTLKYALSQATAGTTIYIMSGTYEEEFPLTVPAGVSVIGNNIRQVIITPTEATKLNDAFLLNGETYVSDLTIKNFYYNNAADTGYGFRFADGFSVTSRSPYIQNVSVITKEVLGTSTPTQITAGPAVTLFSFTSDSVALSKDFYSQSLVDSLVGQTAVIDRYPNPPLFYTVVSIETEPLSPTLWRMTVDTAFDPTGQIKPISFYPDAGAIELVANDIWDTTGNSIGEKWVAWFKTNLPADFNTTVQSGWTINVAGTLYIVDYIIEDPVNTNMWRIYVTTSLVGGVGIPIFSSPTTSTPLVSGRGALVDGSAAMSTSLEASMLFHSVTFITPNSTALLMKNGVRVEWLNSFTYFADIGLHAVNGTEGFADQGIRFGAEVRSIGSANVYGNYGAVADGNDTLVYLINHNFGYIGSGLNSSNDSTLVIKEQEVVRLNSGVIYFTSQSENGNFNVGDSFSVDFSQGTVTFDTSEISFNGLSSIFIQGENNRTYIDAGLIEIGDFKLSNNLIETLTREFNIDSAANSIVFHQNVTATKNILITGDFQTDGTITFGNQAVDTITFNTKISQDLVPNINNVYDLGSTSKKWKGLYSSTLNFNSLKISSNLIESTQLDNDLIIGSKGTGNVYFDGLFFKNNTINSTLNQNIVITPKVSYSTVINKTNSLIVPRSTNTLVGFGDLRYNTSLADYEGFNGARTFLGKLFDSDRDTGIQIHPTNNQIQFNTRNQTSATITQAGLTAVALSVADMIVNNNEIISQDSLTFLSNQVKFGSVISFSNSTISAPENENITLLTSGTGYVQFNSTTGLVIPTGTTSERPIEPDIGTLRYNSTLIQTEVYKGEGVWLPAGGALEEVTTAQFIGEQITYWSLIVG